MANLVEFLAAGITDALGRPLAQGQVTAYLKGTTVRTRLYADEDATVPLPTPAILDDAGVIAAYATTPLTIRIEDKNGALVRTIPVWSATAAYADQVSFRLPDGAMSALSATDVDAAFASWLTSWGGSNWRYLRSEDGAVARYGKDKWGEVFDILDFGATGDGSTDDTTAFDAAVAAMPAAGGQLYLPGGHHYRFTAGVTLDSKTGITVRGDGDTIISTGQTSGAVLTVTDCQRVSVDGLRLLGNADTVVGHTGTGIAVTGTSGYIRISHCSFAGLTAGRGFQTGIDAEVNVAWIEKCDFTDILRDTASSVGIAINLETVTNVLTQGNYIDGSAGNVGVFLGSAAYGCVIGHNMITGALGAGLQISGGSDHAIAHNCLTLCRDGIEVDGSSAGLAFGPNTISAPTRHGMNFQGSVNVSISGVFVFSASGDGFHYEGSTANECHNLSGCLAIDAGLSGFSLKANTDSYLAGCRAITCSRGGSGVSPGFDVSSGSGNFGQNTVLSSCDSLGPDMLAALRVQSNLITDGEVHVMGCNFPPTNSGYSILGPGGGATDNGTLSLPKAATWQDGFRTGGWAQISAAAVSTINLSLGESGYTFSNQGAGATNITFVLPLLLNTEETNGLEYVFCRNFATDTGTISLTVQATNYIACNPSSVAATDALHVAGPNTTVWVGGTGTNASALVRVWSIGNTWFAIY